MVGHGKPTRPFAIFEVANKVGVLMGIEDRDWYRAERRMQRKHESVRFSRAAQWALFRVNAWRTVVYCLAIYGGLHLLLRVFTWAGS